MVSRAVYPMVDSNGIKNAKSNLIKAAEIKQWNKGSNLSVNVLKYLDKIQNKTKF